MGQGGAHCRVGGTSELLYKQRDALLRRGLIHQAKLAKCHPRMRLRCTHFITLSLTSSSETLTCDLNTNVKAARAFKQRNLSIRVAAQREVPHLQWRWDGA